jgi:large conductance mechanosensitive channel
MFKGFRDFILRGNVMDLAVAVIIGAAFTAIVTSLVKDIITPFIAAIVGTPDFSAIKYSLHGSNIMVGNFLNAVIAFVLLAGVVYFFLVIPTQALLKKFNPPAAEPPVTKACPQCLGDVPIAATRCKFCTQPI